MHFGVMQSDCAYGNSELKLYDFAYKRMIVVRSMFKKNLTRYYLNYILNDWINEYINHFKQLMIVLCLC